MSAVSAKKKLLDAIADSNKPEMQACVRKFAQELITEIFNSAPDHTEEASEVLSALIGELALSAADERRRMERQKHQRECVAAAQARGVRFGRRNKPLPDDFEECCQAWRDGELSLKAAAESCGMNKSTFQRAAARMAGPKEAASSMRQEAR